MNLPKILVILGRSGGGYVDKDVFGLVPGFSTIYAGHEAETPRRSQNRSGKVGLRYFPIAPPRWDPAGLLTPILGIQRLIEEIRPAVVVTFELHSIATYQIEHSPKRSTFFHVVQTYETTMRERSLWGAFPLTKLLAESNSSGPDLFLAPSGRSHDMLTDSGVDPSRILSLPLGVYPEEFDRPSNAHKNETSTVLFIGALRKNKGLVTLISALDGVWSADEGAHRLVVAGSGPLNDWLERASKTRRWLRFEQNVSETRKGTLLGDATIFVYPSEDVRVLGRVRWEEQGALSIIEAMMSALPIVATDSGTIREIVPEANPVVPQASPRHLGKAIQGLLADPDRMRRCSNVNLNQARLKFDIRENARGLARALGSRASATILESSSSGRTA